MFKWENWLDLISNSNGAHSIKRLNYSKSSKTHPPDKLFVFFIEDIADYQTTKTPSQKEEK